MSLAKDVGIIAIECYFPRFFVSQKDLEKHNGVSEGKYTIGLGQRNMAFVTDREDVCSIALTALSNLIKKYDLGYENVGRLEVATETIQDHSKSVKTVLMQLFEKSGNFNVEGVDALNACYAATNALFNSAAWVESSDWDGRVAVVVAADVAEYEKGPARPAGGCGAIAFAVGPNAPIRLEPKSRFSHMRHVYDFYKPDFSSPFPVVDGHFSNTCYLTALTHCYRGYVNRFEKEHNEQISVVKSGIDYFVFHSPYNKLAQKALAQTVYCDFRRFQNEDFFKEKRDFLGKFDENDCFQSDELMAELMNISKLAYLLRTRSSDVFSKEIGNSYTASVFFGLFSLLSEADPECLNGKRIVMFSYGSGYTSSIFSFKVTNNAALRKMIRTAGKQRKDLKEKRLKRTPEFFEQVMARNESNYGTKSLKPEADLSSVRIKAFYLVEKDDKGRKFYQRREE